MIVSILIISILLQLTAAILALRLIQITGTIWAWLVIAAAILMMVIRRSVSLFASISNSAEISLSLESEIVATITSLLLVIGISLFSPILKSLRKEHQRIHEQLLDAHPETAAFLLNQHGGIITANKQARTIFQAAWNEGNAAGLVDSLFGRSFRKCFAQLNHDNRVIVREKQIRSNWYDSSIQLIENPSGRPASVALIIRDITETKKSLESQMQHELMLMQADKLATLGTLVTGIAHEINNPNQYILSHLNTIEKAVTTSLPVLEAYYKEYGSFSLAGLPFPEAKEQLPELLRETLQGAQRIQRIISELRSFALKSERQSFTPVQLKEVIDSALVLLRSTINKATHNFKLDINQPLPAIRGHFQQLEQVVVNLVSNACQALVDQNDSIRLELKHEKKTVVLVVEDTGSGIDAEDIERITDPFYTTKREKGGTGLGLAVTKRIIEDHGGNLNFKSELMAGTIVTATFPALNGITEHE